MDDITYIPTWQGWMSLTTVIDCHTKACIRYTMADHLHPDLVTHAPTKAARNSPLAEDAIPHPDHGTPHTNAAFATVTDHLNIRRSVGATGACYDNTLAEPFNTTGTVERANHTAHPTPEHPRTDVTQYIELRHNTQRLHPALSYQTPQEVYDKYPNQQPAA